ncbi:MAG: HAD-IIB family hydrolase [Patescibacteria group bacterium]
MADLGARYADKKLIIFDLDGTLTVSKSPMDQEMMDLLGKLLETKMVAIISGGHFGQFETQFLAIARYPAKTIEHLYLFPTCSTVFYRSQDGLWMKVYEEALSEEERKKIIEAFKKVFADINYQRPETMYGIDLEDRLTQVSFSPLGQKAPPPEKEKWKAAHNPLRIDMCNRVAKYLPDFEVRLGGITTIDVTRKGIDKAYGIKKIGEELKIQIPEMLFIGDAIYPGGNDYAAVEAGVEYIQVSGPEETKKVIRAIVATP